MSDSESDTIISPPIVAGVMVTFAVSALIGTLIAVPLQGARIRLYANYSPKSIGLDGAENQWVQDGDGDRGEWGTDGSVGPRVTTQWAMLKRVKRIEGWYGLYKGTYATLVMMALVLVTVDVYIFLMVLASPDLEHLRLFDWRLFAFAAFVGITALPMTVILNRAVVTPFRLPSRPREALRILLTDRERSSPFALYRTPGLFAATAIRTAGEVLVLVTVFYIFLDTDPAKVSVAQMTGVMLMIILLTMLVFAPLAVICTKLSVQPTLGSKLHLDPEAGAPEGLQFAGAEEDVISLRPATDPYVGLVDAARKIVNEEGWAKLYRGW